MNEIRHEVQTPTVTNNTQSSNGELIDQAQIGEQGIEQRIEIESHPDEMDVGHHNRCRLVNSHLMKILNKYKQELVRILLYAPITQSLCTWT